MLGSFMLYFRDLNPPDKVAIDVPCPPVDKILPVMREKIRNLIRIDPDEKFLWYSPHSGFGNQLVALRNALRMAGILNRTLVVPPSLPHTNGILLGNCAGKASRVTAAWAVREIYWRVLLNTLSTPAYTSMADIVDVASIAPDMVRTIDVRLFLALKCGLNVSVSLSGCSWCHHLLKELNPLWQSVRAKMWRAPNSATEEQFQRACGFSLGIGREGVVKLVGQRSVYIVERDCSTALFTYKKDWRTGSLLEEHDRKPRSMRCTDGRPFTYTNRMTLIQMLEERDRQKLPPLINFNVQRFLGSGNPNVNPVSYLTFPSAFFFFDFSIPMYDERADAISCATEFLAFTPPIMRVAVDYAANNISHPFLCLHFRGGDMFYKKLVSKTMERANKDLAAFRRLANLDRKRVYPLFLMTDMRTPDWTNRFHRSFEEPLGYQLKFANDLDAYHAQIRQAVLSAGRGILANRLHLDDVGRLAAWTPTSNSSVAKSRKYMENVGVVLEQSVCACADLGFIPNELSSVSKNIQHLRNGGSCKMKYD